MRGRILLIVHRETSDPGRIGRLVSEFGYEPVICRHACGDPLPQTLEDYAAAAIFGGPMSANDADSLDFIRAELDWIEVPLRENKPFLGICLGAQILARALGAEVGPHEAGYHEIGYYPLRATEAGQHLFAEEQMFYQWHGEGFDLPAGASLLAEGEIFANQAFAYGDNAYAVQFHPDVTGEMIHRWSSKPVHRMVLRGARSRDTHLNDQALYDPGVEEWAKGFFAHWLGVEKPMQQAEAAD
jgi:GMP synthase (glutamine-hydrolysing)